MSETSIAERVAQLLEGRELTLGTIECGVDGVVSHRLFQTETGVNVLGDSLVVDDVGEAIGLIDLPRPQFRKAGDFSAKAARAAAREGRDFLGVHVCLAVWARGPVDSEAEQTVYVALHTGREAAGRAFQVGGASGRDEDWLADQALDMVWQALA